jgi:hypothetical protein
MHSKYAYSTVVRTVYISYTVIQTTCTVGPAQFLKKTSTVTAVETNIQ